MKQRVIISSVDVEKAYRELKDSKMGHYVLDADIIESTPSRTWTLFICGHGNTFTEGDCRSAGKCHRCDEVVLVKEVKE